MGTINFVWWNLQNFFDTDDDPISKDFEYTAAHGWTEEVFAAKKANLAAALNATHNGQGPELLAVAEIEKDSLLASLLETMQKPDLVVARDPQGTRDLRGIDVAVAYDQRKLTLLSRTSHMIHLRYRTRDIYEVEFRVNETGERLLLFATHWPSRSRGRYLTDPLRIAVAEHISYLIENQVKVEPEAYEKLRESGNIAAVREKWETKVLLAGDFNDEPSDRSVVEHLHASSELDRAIGATNDIDGFKKQTADYRGQDVFLFNAMWKFLHLKNTGSFFLDALRSGDKFANRYQVLDQIVASRGLVSGHGLTLDINSVDIFRDKLVSTASGRPRPFDKKRKSGASDHLPVTAVLRY
ncbi:MAG: hypothetical protein HC802_22670 [Caldilineaceae bacterium]|nr:hypothetical protein [Caldilineaceae bacterium]